jgi:hypothetical protein
MGLQDACQPVAPITGKIAFVEASSTCLDVQKVLSVQAAGAVGAILVSDNVGYVPTAPTGTDDMSKVMIRSVRITKQDADKIRPSLGAAPIATLRIDPQRGIGTSAAGRVYLDATDPVEDGVSVAHWDPMVVPHMLMQPTLEPSESLDLTVPLMSDLGWLPSKCGDRVVEGAEQCDEGPNPDGGLCTADCTLIGGARDGGRAPGAARDGGAVGDAGDAGPDGSGAVGDAGFTPPPGPNRYLDGGRAAGYNGIPFVPKHGGCSCRLGSERAASGQALGFSGAALVLGVFLGRRRTNAASRAMR